MDQKNKLNSNFDPTPHVVVGKRNGDVIVSNDDNGKSYRRNIMHLKRVEGEWKVLPKNSKDLDENEEPEIEKSIKD